MDNPTLNTAPTDPAYDLAAVKAHLRISRSDEDAPLTKICDTAVAAIQDATGRVFLSSTWTWVLDSFVGNNDRTPDADFWYSPYPYGRRSRPVLAFPILPLQSVQSVQYIDAGGVTRTMASSDYQVDSVKGRIAPAPSATWPATQAQAMNAVSINFTAGYVNAGAIPVKLRHALYMLIGHWWENREATSLFTVKDIPYSVDAMLGEFKCWRT